MARKLQEDPLYIIKKIEIESQSQILKNPVKLKQLQELVSISLGVPTAFMLGMSQHFVGGSLHLLPHTLYLLPPPTTLLDVYAHFMCQVTVVKFILSLKQEHIAFYPNF